ncbi:MAG: hypothetical protein LBM70_07175 [Victivallales bacterium]|nr:hypothetical protein [Victivallales bacterium]
MMNALFIDDNENSIAPAMDIFKKNNFVCQNITFADYATEISKQKPDVVVLDMMNGGTTEDPLGNGGKDIYAKIWEWSFCPIIIYSANPDLCGAPTHPFIAKIQKGTGSENSVWESACRFQPYLEARMELNNHIEEILNSTLRDTALAIDNLPETKSIDKILLRLTRRRIAAAMDDGLDVETKMQPYEQYIFPVVGDNWLQGDVIEKGNSFFLVLTPSCDLVKRNGGINARSILCARCCPYDKKLLVRFFKSEKIQDCCMCKECTKDKDTCKNNKAAHHQKQKVKELTSMLNSGIVGHYFVLPGMADVLPALLADLKNYLLVEVDDMDSYKRVISIDSPFREQLSWVFVSIAGRPGMPDRDFSKWASQNI